MLRNKAQQEFIETLLPFFRTEFTEHYFHPGMQSTPQLVSDSKIEGNWTNLIAVDQKDDQAKTKKIELERTLTGLYCFSLCKKNQYELFTAPQSPKEKLSEDSFKQLSAEVKETIKNSSTETVLNCLMTYSDLGKSPHTRTLAKKFGIDPQLDTDDIVLEILKLPDEKVQQIIPSFSLLKEDEKSQLRLAYPLMTICLGHLYFLEAGIKNLEYIAIALKNISPEKRKELLQLVFLAQFFDGVGSQGQVDYNGSLTCTENFFQGYRLVRQTLFNLEKYLNETNNVEKSAELALNHYLAQRAEWIKLDRSGFKKEEHFQCVLRLACLLRIFDPSLAKKLQQQFYELTPEHQILLSTQLNFIRDQGLNRFVRDPHYVATFPQNHSMRAFKEGKPNEAITLGIEAAICFASMVKELNSNYEADILNPLYPLSFGKLAFRGREPGFLKADSFDPTLAKWALQRPAPSTAIKNLIFDLGHVLVRIDKSRNATFQALSMLTGKSIFEIRSIANEKPMQALFNAYECGQITTPVFRVKVKELLGIQLSDKQFDEAFCASIVADNKEVQKRLAYIDELEKQGYRVFLLSNNSDLHLAYIKKQFGAAHWGRYFFKQYYSHLIGSCKPDPATFQQIIKDNQLKPEETAFFDDVFHFDLAAREKGIFARQFSVNRPMTDIIPMIKAIDQAKERKIEVTNSSTLGIFAIHKWKQWVAQKKENISVEDRKKTNTK